MHKCPLFTKKNEIICNFKQWVYRPSVSQMDSKICAVRLNRKLNRHLQVSPEMLRLTSSKLRSEFIEFFQSIGSSPVTPSSVFPKKNEGSYFVNAGMNQFKSVLLGKRNSAVNEMFSVLHSAVNSQPCIRIGGRHDDLNDVGFDSYHHTFFEMLGNWTFNNCDKEETCLIMWKLLTEVLKIPPEALYVTYFAGDDRLGLPADNETRNIWLKLGVKDIRLMSFGMKDNFWQADLQSGGGLCGPSTEIHVDLRAMAGYGLAKSDLRCARCFINKGTPEVIELWNAVFITHKQIPKDNNDTGPFDLVRLPRAHVDTGMGLERLAAILQGVASTYDTDIFMDLFAHIESCLPASSNAIYGGIFVNPFEDKNHEQIFDQTDSGQPEFVEVEDLHRDIAYRIIADHARALAVSLHDGLLPGRQGLALKLRHLTRRAARAAILGLQLPDPSKLIASTVSLAFDMHSSQMHQQWFDRANLVRGPNAIRPSDLSRKHVEEIILGEFKGLVEKVKQQEMTFQAWQQNPSQIQLISGISRDMLSFQLKWYGLDPSKNLANFDDYFAQQHNHNHNHRLSQSHGLNDDNGKALDALNLQALNLSSDDSYKYRHRRLGLGQYEFPDLETSLLAVKLDKEPGSWLSSWDKQVFSPGDRFWLITEASNFFAPCGGQSCDIGSLILSHSDRHQLAQIHQVRRVEDKDLGFCCIIHEAEWSSDTVTVLPKRATLQIDRVTRFAHMQHHTAQHLFHLVAKWQDKTIQQQGGGRVTADHFTIKLALPVHESRALCELMTSIETECNERIESDNDPEVTISSLPWRDVQDDQRVAKYVWEEYPKDVRVVWLGHAQGELCGGTHLESLAEIGQLCVTNVRATTSHNVKEIRVVVNEEAVKLRQNGFSLFSELTAKMGHLPMTVENWQSLLKTVELNLGQGNHFGFIDRCRLEALRDELKDGLLEMSTDNQQEISTELLQNLMAREQQSQVMILFVDFKKNKAAQKSLANVELTGQQRVLVLGKSNASTVLFMLAPHWQPEKLSMLNGKLQPLHLQAQTSSDEGVYILRSTSACRKMLAGDEVVAQLKQTLQNLI